VKALIEFADRHTSLLDIPDEMRHRQEIVTAKPGELKNMTAKFTGWHGQGYPVFKEIAEKVNPSS